MRLLLICITMCCAAACGAPSTPPDTDAGEGDAAAECELEICLSGQIDDEPQSFIAGWWGPTLGFSEPSMTGGFTASVEVTDACEEVQSMDPPPDGWSFSFLVRDRDGDGNRDGLPDPGTYPIVSGWEEEHSEAAFAELLIGRAEGGLALPATAATAEGGTLTIYEVEAGGRVIGELDARFQEGLGQVAGSFSIHYCVPVRN